MKASLPVSPLPAKRFRTLFPALSGLCTVLLLFIDPVRAADRDTEQPVNLEEFAIPDWSITSSLSLAAGYRDNILLSPANPDRSAFIKAEGDAMFLRLPTRGWDGYVFLDLSETRYLSADQTNHERTGFVTSELRWQASDSFKAGLTGQAYHHDQIFDVSADQATLDTAQLKVTGGTLAPFVRWTFTPNWWVEARGTGRKDRFADHIDGYKEGEGSFTIGHDWASGSSLSLAAARRWRSHDFREQYTESGRPITGTLLQANQREISLKYSLIPAANKKWKATFAASRVENRDNGSGYFDFNRQQFGTTISWKQTPWDVRLSAVYDDYVFPVQLVGIGISPENRHKQDARITVEATHKLTACCDWVAGYEFERASSNDERSKFKVSSFYLGLQWNWDNLGSD